MRRIDTLFSRSRPTEQRYSWGEYLGDALGLNSGQLLQTTWGTQDRTEPISNSFIGYTDGAYKGCSVVFAVIGARMRLFTEARFQYQTITNGRPTDLFDDPALAILVTPWPNGTTADLLARLEQDASLAGNSYTLRRRGRLKRLRPDWVEIIVASPTQDPNDLDAIVIGYLYWPGGRGVAKAPITLLPEDVAHYAPTPDPTAHYRGMSWLTPVLEEIRADKAATMHKGKFFDNAATPNLAVSLDKAVTAKQYQELLELMKNQHVGVDKAYQTMYLAGGADVTVVGADMKQLDFKITQGAGETRIAAAGGVPPILVPLSEGLSASTYSNYGQAKRHMADGFARPAWRSAAGALGSIVPAKPGARLWYDDRDIPFLADDLTDETNVQEKRANTIRQLTDAGYTPDSVVAAVQANDFDKLVHSGLYSVQLQKPGAGDALDQGEPDPAPAPA